MSLFLKVFFPALCFLFSPSGTPVHVHLTVQCWSVHRSANALSVFLFYFFSLGFILDKFFWSVFKVTNYLIILLVFLLNLFIFSMYLIFQIYNFYLFFLIIRNYWNCWNYLFIHLFLPFFPIYNWSFKLFSVNSSTTSFVVLYFSLVLNSFFFNCIQKLGIENKWE